MFVKQKNKKRSKNFGIFGGNGAKLRKKTKIVAKSPMRI